MLKGKGCAASVEKSLPCGLKLLQFKNVIPILTYSFLKKSKYKMFPEQKVHQAPFDLNFVVPSNFILAGSSQSGKSSWLLKLFETGCFTKPIRHIIYYFSEKDALHTKFAALPDTTVIFKNGPPESLQSVRDEINQFPLEEIKAVIFDGNKFCLEF